MGDARARSSSHDDVTTFSEEQRCIALVRAGDESALKALYDRYADAMFAFAYTSLGSRVEAEDVVHDVFLTILRQRTSWHVEGRLRVYLFRAVHNRLATRRRHLRVELRSHESIARDAGQPSEWVHRGATDDELGERELAAALERAVESLSPRAQQAYRLVREHHLSYAETAEVMGISVHTVELHLIRALKTLRDRLSAWRR